MRFRRHLALLLVCTMGGCGGRLDDYAPFLDPEVALPCADPQSTFDTIVKPKCANSGCHDAESKSGSLDMESPGLKERILNQPAALCQNEVLFTLNTPLGDGYMLNKIGAAPRCGAPMPRNAPALTDAERKCFERWLLDTTAAQ